MKAVDLLQDMQRRRQPFAIVVDEQGGVAGIVAMEDVLEELVGDMFSEHDRDVPDPIKRGPDGSVLTSGSTPVRDINRELGFCLPEDGEFTTIAGLCLELAGRIPATGDTLSTRNGFVLEIVDASPRRVRSVRIRRASTANGSHASPAA
jgi:putative hemolysin